MILRVVVFETPPDTDVTVTVDGPLGVASGTVAQPISPPMVISSNASDKYAAGLGSRAVAWRLTRNIPVIDASDSAINHSKLGFQGVRSRGVGAKFAVVVIVSVVVLPDGLPARVFAGFTEQPAPFSDASTAQE